MNPKVSIVVPIYHVEKYLPCCVDSLLSQTLTDIEIILVDDGSPDRCGEIADSYARKDPRVKVIHQENAGLGPARNAGIRAASGDYIGFVDSDDWVRPEMYRRLYETAVETCADIVAGGYQDMVNGKVRAMKHHPLAGVTMTSHKEIMEMRKGLYGPALRESGVDPFPMAVWIALYSRKLIQGSGVSFRNIMSEDIIFNLDIYPHAKVISFTEGTDYCYRKEGQPSITKTFSQTKQKKFVEFLQILREKAEDEGNEECILRAKRKTIDCHRSYVAMVDGSGMSFGKKRQYAKAFAEDTEIIRCWTGYPVETLPFKQRIFQKALMKKCYGIALFINLFHQKVKQGIAYVKSFSLHDR